MKDQYILFLFILFLFFAGYILLTINSKVMINLKQAMNIPEMTQYKHCMSSTEYISKDINDCK